MKTVKVYRESYYVGAEEEYEIEVEDDATEEEIAEAAYEEILANLNWHYEVEEKDADE